jgi:hypothetical protein
VFAGWLSTCRSARGGEGAASPCGGMDSRMWAAMPETVRSVVIHNYADKTAYGTANLTETEGS